MSKQFPITGNLIDELVYWEQNNGAPYHRAALDELERLEDILHQVTTWCRAYPRTVFIEPTKEQWAEANQVLNDAGGCSLTAISGSNMRHVVEGIQKIIETDHD